MPVQKTHRVARPQAPRHDELPDFVPDTDPARSGAVERDSSGRVTGTEAARTLARKAKGVRKGRTKLSHELGLGWMNQIPSARPFVSSARAFARAQCSEIARSVGGGQCGPGPSSLVTSAALQLAASRWLFDSPPITTTGSAAPNELASRLVLASKLADASRQNLLTAYELAAREAQARQQTNAGGGAARLFADLDTEAVEQQYRELLGQVQAEEGGTSDD